MPDKSKFLEDVGMKNLPFPMRVLSKSNPDGQPTIANISISARIMREFEAQWIDRFIQVLHKQGKKIGPESLRANILDYQTRLGASAVRVDFDYPFFIEKTTPVSQEKCMVRYLCTYSAKSSTVGGTSINFKIEVPVITTYPVSVSDKPGGLFGQLSIVAIEIASEKDVFPEDLVEIVDRYAIAPVYSYLTEEDQKYIIERVHSEEITSVDLVGEIKKELAHNKEISWYSVSCTNHGMLHSYSTAIGIEKSPWIPST
ncbi:MAG TPA: GTP cyclohydrolase, FolE2/MptA family [Geobacteraceae bacterium]|nr:GTP cyclohydrolase, FolE2/MptA family [Geobacteraceae bacterium]